jgi:hypothetical protein
MLRHTGGYNALPLNALCGLIFGWHVTTEVRREIAGVGLIPAVGTCLRKRPFRVVTG